jgi:transcriptional pleiotropic regulator of transition state genes
VFLLKPTGFVRLLDGLGRIVIPMELRRRLGIQSGDGVEILVNGSDLILQKWLPGCIFCGNTEGLTKYRSKWMCVECADLLGRSVRGG